LSLTNAGEHTNQNTFQIIATHQHMEGGVELEFVTTFEDNLVPAQVVVDDLSLLTLSHISAMLQVPVISIKCELIFHTI